MNVVSMSLPRLRFRLMMRRQWRRAEAKSRHDADLFAVRSVLFLPASNPRAIAKAREARADMVVLDLEDAVKPADKEAAREAAVEAVARALADAGRDPDQRRARHPGTSSTSRRWRLEAADRRRAATPGPTSVRAVARNHRQAGAGDDRDRRGVLAAAAIAPETAGLIAGTNDLAADLGLPPGRRPGAARRRAADDRPRRPRRRHRRLRRRL
jgi:hypothetical protein